MPSPPTEIEWQFDAVDLRPVARWLSERPASDGPVVEPNGTRDIADTYLDTEDWRLHRAGLSLRVRSVDGRSEATLKSRTAPIGALRERIEITQPIDAPDPASLGR